MMKTTLHHLPQSKQRDLARIVETVRNGFEQVRANYTPSTHNIKQLRLVAASCLART